MSKLRRTSLFILMLAAFIGIAAANHDYFLLPESFFMHKGDKLDVHLLSGDQFVKQDEIGYPAAKTTRFMLYDGNKKIDLSKLAKDTVAPLVSYRMENHGQALLEMTLGVDHSSSSRDSYAEFLTGQGYDKLAEKVKSSNQFRVKEKYTRYLKTLVSVGDHDGNAYEKVLNDEYEIILKDNPYDKKYGDDMSALLKFKGKPAGNAAIALYIKSIGGNVYPQNLITDKNGMINFTMTREGIYLLRSVRVEATKDNDADYESWWASYTFAFSSSDEVLNTYKEFGFGNIH